MKIEAIVNKKRISRLAIALLILLILCCLFRYSTPGESAVAKQEAPAVYPSQWQKIGMPVIPKACVVWSSGDNSLEEGIEFELEVQNSAEEIADFLDEEFLDQDFDETDWTDKQDGFSSSYNSGNVDVNVDVRPGLEGNKKRVRISINRKPEQKNAPTSYASVIFD